VVEVVFNIHGLGYLAWESIGKGDFPVVQAVVLLFSLIFVGLTVASDLVSALLDPRVRGT
jgi:peptide/nickel transport system permease protein